MKYKQFFDGIDLDATSERIDSEITKSGYTSKDISEMMNISYQSIHKWRRKKSLPDLDNLYILSKIINVSIDDMLVGRDR